MNTVTNCTITVCIGSSCHLKGSYEVVRELQRLISDYVLEDKVTIKASFCMGSCTKPVCTRINNGEIISLSKENVGEFFNTRVMEIL